MNLKMPFIGEAPITQRFGERITDPRGHSGIDFAVPLGTPIQAADAGTVDEVQRLTYGYGKYVLVRHHDGSESLYAHLSAIHVSAGQQVPASATIGLSGSSGNSTGPHLHFEIRKNGKAIDPEPLLFLTANQPQAPRWQVICAALNLRSGPGIGYPVIGALKKGCMIAAQAEQCERWIKIKDRQWAAAVYQNEELMKPLDADEPAQVDQ